MMKSPMRILLDDGFNNRQPREVPEKSDNVGFAIIIAFVIVGVFSTVYWWI